jgi:hypothetical protein
MCSQFSKEGLLFRRIEGGKEVKYLQPIVFDSLSTITLLEQDLGYGAFATVVISMAERLVCYKSRSCRTQVVKGADFESGVFDIPWMAVSALTEEESSAMSHIFEV